MTLPGGWELVLVVLVIMVLFGAKRLPDASRSLGRSLRILKAETKGLRDDDAATSVEVTTDATTAPDPRDDPAYQRWLAQQPPAPGAPPAADPPQRQQ